MESLSLSLLAHSGSCCTSSPFPVFHPAKPRPCSVYLAVTTADQPGRAVPREVLMELLWPGMPLEFAQANLRTTLLPVGKTVPDQNLPDGSVPVSFVLSERQEVKSTHRLIMISM